MRDRKFKVVCETESLISLLLLLLLLLPLCCSQTLSDAQTCSSTPPPSPSFSPLCPWGADPHPAAAPRTLLHPGIDLRRPLSNRTASDDWEPHFFRALRCSHATIPRYVRCVGGQMMMMKGRRRVDPYSAPFVSSWAGLDFFLSLFTFPKAQCYFQSGHSGKRSKQDYTTNLDCIFELSLLQSAPVCSDPSLLLPAGHWLPPERVMTAPNLYEVLLQTW